MTTTYCTSADVSKFLYGDKKGDFSESTKPLKTTVEAIINRAEDEIDDATKHAWRSVLVTNEYHDYFGLRYARGSRAYSRGGAPCCCVHLNHRIIRAFTSGTHKIEIWDDDEWVDLVLTANGYTEGRDDDYWIDYEGGVIYFVNETPVIGPKMVRVTYAYGETTVPGDIKEWAIKQTAINLLYSDDWTAATNEPWDRIELAEKVRHWKEDIEKIRLRHKELLSA